MLLCGDILEVCLKYLIKKLTVTQSSIHQTHRFDCCFYDYFIITLPKNILIENILDAFFLHIEFGNKLITALQRSFKRHVDTCHYGIDSLFVLSRKTDTGR